MTTAPAQLRARILDEIATLRGDLEQRLGHDRRPAPSIVRAYLATIDRHYLRLDALDSARLHALDAARLVPTSGNDRPAPVSGLPR